MSIDQKFLNLFIKATEKAAIGASKFIGTKDKSLNKVIQTINKRSYVKKRSKLIRIDDE